MSKIYQDALADAKKLREIAEQNAKNKIIEAVAPRIKQLIENELMSDDEDSIEFLNLQNRWNKLNCQWKQLLMI